MSFAAQDLADRVRAYFEPLSGVTERKMFGGHAFMLHGNMICGIMKDGQLLARVGKENMEAALAEPGVGPMVMGERTMGGYVAVGGDIIEDEGALAAWLERCRAFAASLPPK